MPRLLLQDALHVLEQLRAVRANFNAATGYTELPLVCPKCGAMNLRPPATPTIEIDRYGHANCATCGHGWTLKWENGRC